jgi:hypothetical protein
MPKLGQTARARIRGHARRGAKAIGAGLRFANDMPADALRSALAEQSTLGLLEHIARDRNIPTMPEVATKPLSYAEAAKAFLGKIGVKLDSVAA